VAASPEPDLIWTGALACVIFTVIAITVIATTGGWLPPGGSTPAIAAAPSTESSPVPSDRTECAEFGSSDLRSPAEGVWYQANCTGTTEPGRAGGAECNRTSLDPVNFRLVAPGLFVYSRTPTSRASLWYASSDTCYHLVSARAVTFVCADKTVSFSRSDDACSAHGGVLAKVNAR
jgi:hypothetical protein